MRKRPHTYVLILLLFTSYLHISGHTVNLHEHMYVHLYLWWFIRVQYRHWGNNSETSAVKSSARLLQEGQRESRLNMREGVNVIAQKCYTHQSRMLQAYKQKITSFQKSTTWSCKSCWIRTSDKRCTCKLQAIKQFKVHQIHQYVPALPKKTVVDPTLDFFFFLYTKMFMCTAHFCTMRLGWNSDGAVFRYRLLCLCCCPVTHCPASLCFDRTEEIYAACGM